MIASAVSGETAPSDGHTPFGFWPNARSWLALASSSWNAASSGYANGGSGSCALGSARSAARLSMMSGRIGW